MHLIFFLLWLALCYFNYTQLQKGTPHAEFWLGFSAMGAFNSVLAALL